jgi:hypothetical protein
MTTPRSTSVRRPRRGVPARLAGALALLGLVSCCGVPGDGHARTIQDDTVPYHLLQGDRSTKGPPTSVSPPVLVPVVFWVGSDDRLVAAAAGGSCADPVDELVAHQLVELTAGPAEDARSVGRSTALPPAPGLRLVSVVDRTARVEMDPSTSVSAERLPLAVGQVVLTLTSTPAIERVVFLVAGRAVRVPLPGGALTVRPVTASDYAVLLAPRFRDSRVPVPRLSRTVGCPGR